MKFHIFLIFFFLILQSASGQVPGLTNQGQVPGPPADSSLLHNLSAGFRLHYGSFTGDQPKLLYIEDGHPFLAELDIMSQTTGTRSWQQASNFPRIGMALLYGQSGANVYIGHLAAVMPFVDFHLFSRKDVTTDLRLAVGPAWVQRTFNPQTDYQNLVIGSHINACLNIMLTENIRLSPHTAMDLGFSFTHISNGSFKLPNLGLNLPALTVGFRYDLFPEQQSQRTRLLPIKKKVNYYFYAFVAAKQSLPLESAVYLVNIFNAEVLKDFAPNGRFGGGINMTLDRANSTEVPNSGTFAWDRSQSHWQAAVYGVYEYVLGDLSFPLQVGYYLYNKYPVNSIYQNIGVKYRFAPRWTAGFSLKAHLGNGDFFQWGLGYKF
jgi:hypothetical protein